MTTPSLASVGPVLLVLADDAQDLRSAVTAGLDACGVVQPDPDWMARFRRHLELASRQGDAADDPDLAVGECMLWLGQRLHLGHGMLLDESFVTTHRPMFDRLVDQGLLRLVVLCVSPAGALDGMPAIRVDAVALRADPPQWVRTGILDRLDD